MKARLLACLTLFAVPFALPLAVPLAVPLAAQETPTEREAARGVIAKMDTLER